MTVVPMRGRYEQWRALLGEIMEDDSVEHLVVVTFGKDGTVKSGHYECTREEMAFGALLLQKKAMED